MFDKRDVPVGGRFSEDEPLEGILEESSQYSKRLRKEYQQDRRRGGFFYFAFVLLVALMGIALVWMSH